MPPNLAPPVLADIQAARARLHAAVVRTPLIRLPGDGSDIWLKLENLQPIGSFKLRGALNAIGLADPARLREGVVTASAGNMGQGVAWGARELGYRCQVVVPDHAPATKLAALERLGAQVTGLPFDAWWTVLEQRRYDPAPGHFIHPVSDPAVIAGNATIGLEIAEDLPDVDLVLAPYGGGGLSCGIAAALRAVAPRARVVAVEPETAAPLAASLRAGSPQPAGYTASFVDGAGGRAVLAEMWPLARQLLAGSATVSLAQVAEAIRFLAERVRVVAEGAGALAVAAARAGSFAGQRVVAVVSGGNLDGERLVEILRGRVPG